MQHSLGQFCLTLAALCFSSGKTGKGKQKVGSHSIRAQERGDLGWRTQQRPRTAEAKVLVSNSPKLPAKPTPQTGEAVTMTDFAVQRRRQRQRRMGGCCMRKTGRGGKKREAEESKQPLWHTTDDDLPGKHSTWVMKSFVLLAKINNQHCA